MVICSKFLLYICIKDMIILKSCFKNWLNMFILKLIDVCNINCVIFLINEKLIFLILIFKNFIKIICVKNF